MELENKNSIVWYTVTAVARIEDIKTGKEHYPFNRIEGCELVRLRIWNNYCQWPPDEMPGISNPS